MLTAKSRSNQLRPHVQVRRDFDRTETGTVHFMPREEWAGESIAAFVLIVKSRGFAPALAQQLIDTYTILALGTFEPVFIQVRALVAQLLKEDGARDRLFKKLLEAGLEVPDTKRNLTVAEALGCLDDVEREAARSLHRAHSFDTILVLAPVLKTGLAWPFCGNFLEGTGFTGLIPSLMGLTCAAILAAATSALILSWMRALMALLPQHNKTAIPGGKGGIEPLADDVKAVQSFFDLLHPAHHVHPVVNAISFVIFSLLIVFCWMQWRVCDLYTFTTRFYIPVSIAQPMASTLVTLMFGIGLLGAYRKTAVVAGNRQIKRFRRHLQAWMADEIAALAASEVDKVTYDEICSRWSWACTQVQQIAFATLWIDVNDPAAGKTLHKQMLGLETSANKV